MKTRLLFVLAALAITTPSFAQLESPNATGVALGHIHINAADVDAQTRFWAGVGGQIVQREKLTMVQIPDVYRAVDHIGFEVKNIDAFVAKLQAAGIKTDAPVRNSTNASGLRIAYTTDPWGTEIELTEGLNTTPLAGASK
jgi:catechol-2,3-dioxygenase